MSRLKFVLTVIAFMLGIAQMTLGFLLDSLKLDVFGLGFVVAGLMITVVYLIEEHIKTKDLIITLLKEKTK